MGHAAGAQRGFDSRVWSLQVISAVLAFLTRGMPPLALNAGTKTPADYWSRGGDAELVWRGRREKYVFPKSAEGELTVLSGELLTGVADKAVYGRYGLVHAVQVRAGLVVTGIRPHRLEGLRRAGGWAVLVYWQMGNRLRLWASC